MRMICSAREQLDNWERDDALKKRAKEVGGSLWDAAEFEFITGKLNLFKLRAHLKSKSKVHIHIPRIQNNC